MHHRNLHFIFSLQYVYISFSAKNAGSPEQVNIQIADHEDQKKDCHHWSMYLLRWLFNDVSHAGYHPPAART